MGRNQCTRLPFGAAPSGNMLQKKIDELFNDICNVFGIAHDSLFLFTGFDGDGRDHDVRLEQVLQKYRQANLQLTTEKCLSMYMHTILCRANFQA